MSTIKNAVKLERSKCRKGEAFNAIKRLIDNKHDDEAKEILYAHFLPIIKKVKPLEPLLWLKLAISKVNDVRECLSYIYVEDGYAMASDGSVAHRIKCGLDDGYYDPLTLEPVDCDHVYPNFMIAYNRVRWDGLKSMGDFEMGISDDDVRDVYRSLKYKGNIYLYDYIANAFGGKDSVNIGVYRKVLVVEEGDRVAVIAPIRSKSNNI